MRTRGTLDGGGLPDQGTSSRSSSALGGAQGPSVTARARRQPAPAPEPDRPAPITVALGCFSSVFALGLSDLLGKARELEVLAVDVADSRLEEVIARLRPAVAMLDEQSVIDLSLARRLCASAAAPALIVLSARPSRPYCERLLGSGARACLRKDASASEILSVVHLAASGWQLLAPPLSVSPQRSDCDDADSLSAREREVLRLLRLEQTYVQIGRTLQIEPETVRSHAKHICRKLSVDGRRSLRGG